MKRQYLLSLSLLAMACGGGSSSEMYFIPGSAKVPSCTEAPSADLSGTWFDSGAVTIRTAGCDDALPDEIYSACSLNWMFSQTGNDLEIIVDDGYRIIGRTCADRLYLEGGWWLPVQDEGVCTYAEDSAEEVGIEAEGALLTLDAEARTLSGKLVVQGRCRAEYMATFAMAAQP